MAKLALIVLSLVFVSINAGCHRRPGWCPWPGKAPPKSDTASPSGKISDEDKKRIRTKDQLTNKLDKISKKLHELELSLADKRAQGIDVSKAEDIFQKSKNLLKEADKLYLEANLYGNYEPVIGLLRAVEDSFETISQEIKKAPRFREKTKPELREFADDRDWVTEKMGHSNPVNTRVGPYSSFSFDVMEPTEFLRGAITWGCFEPRTNRFTLQTPPKVMIMEYNTGSEGTYQFVFVENNPHIQQFALKQEIRPEERDQALTSLCASQGSGYESYSLIAAYKGKMAGSPEEYLRQLLSGQFRFVDQFGLPALASRAKAAAPLPDLELVSIVFNKKVGPLIIEQAAILNKIFGKLSDYKPGAVFNQERGELIFDQSAENRIKKAFSAIASWQNSLSPRKKDKTELLRLVNDDKGISDLLNSFEETISALAKEINLLTKELLRFKREYPELVFYDDERPIMVMLLKGVGFRVDLASRNTLFKKDVPQLMVETELSYIRNKYDENPPVILKNSFKITEANKLIDVSKDYQRLTSFILGWPASARPLVPGNYKIAFKITDEVREKTILHEVNFLVLSAKLRQEQKGR